MVLELCGSDSVGPLLLGWMSVALGSVPINFGKRLGSMRGEYSLLFGGEEVAVLAPALGAAPHLSFARMVRWRGQVCEEERVLVSLSPFGGRVLELCGDGGSGLGAGGFRWLFLFLAPVSLPLFGGRILELCDGDLMGPLLLGREEKEAIFRLQGVAEAGPLPKREHRMEVMSDMDGMVRWGKRKGVRFRLWGGASSPKGGSGWKEHQV